jgi:hypothetical protein
VSCFRSWLFVVLLASYSAAEAHDFIYEGPWHTTNRKLDGTMTCAVTDLGDQTWRGHFYGVWNGTPIDYTVPFTGPPSSLHGTAVIDGASYAWTGAIQKESPGWFKGTFGGSAYEGSFDLKETSKGTPARPRSR